MEKKVSSASSKLKSLKEFLVSTRSLNHQNYDANLKKPQHSTSKLRSSIRNTKNSISLFNLIAASGNERDSNTGDLERPISMALDEQYGYAYEDRDITPRLLPNKSVSMYGLTPIDSCSNTDGSTLHPTSSTRNLAARFFNNLRSKFRRRRRDRNKIVDSKSTEFSGTLFPESSQTTSSLTIFNESEANAVKPSSARYQLKSANSLDTILDTASFNNNGAIINDNDLTEPTDFEAASEKRSVAATSRSNNFDELGLNLKFLAESSEGNCSFASVNTSERRLSPNPVSSLIPVTQNTSPRPIKCLTKELEDLLHYGWYWGGLSKDETEAKLKDQPDGAFVVRDSSSDHYLLSLSFNSNGKTLHTRIEYRNAQFCFSPDSDSFNTVAELIQHCIAYSEEGVFCYSRRFNSASTSYPVRLTKPISRFTEVKSLLYLSRLVIRQNVRFDLIPFLPLPASLIEFVSEQRYI
ncbi:unnamed protein product [Orchesella dallaii]|uniref:Suppressor of cytokine signaling 6 n=1 Tax=Orchesella dallaii TaxID=48710 RepID=A0ABP1RDA3_9HEXA